MNGHTPQHIAIIMDGNRRWASKSKVSKIQGHRTGAKALKQAIKAVIERGIPYLTVYAFSTENWERSEQEVSDLLGLMREFLEKETPELVEKDIKLVIAGDRSVWKSNDLALIESTEKQTHHCSRLTLNIALNYGSRQEISHAFTQYGQALLDGRASLNVSWEDVTEYLYTSQSPEVDLLIRTAGVSRLSNFMLLQSAYAEIMILDKHWPDFTQEDMEKCLLEYGQIARNFGK